MTTKILWVLFAFFAITIGLYPFSYYLFQIHGGFLTSKPVELLNSYVWKSFFYTHITFGGIALLSGWTQFSNKLRNRNPGRHRFLGKIYVITVMISGCASLYMAIYSNNGIITHFGFAALGFLWLFTTIKAYTAIRNIDIINHQKWMIRSYALCFAAVTLRIWFPLLAMKLGMETGYQIVSWLCWVPNLSVAEWIISNISRRKIILLAS